MSIRHIFPVAHNNMTVFGYTWPWPLFVKRSHTPSSRHVVNQTMTTQRFERVFTGLMFSLKPHFFKNAPRGDFFFHYDFTLRIHKKAQSLFCKHRSHSLCFGLQGVNSQSHTRPGRGKALFSVVSIVTVSTVIFFKYVSLQTNCFFQMCSFKMCGFSESLDLKIESMSDLSDLYSLSCSWWTAAPGGQMVMNTGFLWLLHVMEKRSEVEEGEEVTSGDAESLFKPSFH